MSLNENPSVAAVIARSIAAAGVSHVFAVPGESYLPLLDAMLDVPVAVVTCRHEAAAANMAEAAAKLDGAPGVAMVTRGPGACHASIGLHTAQQDSTPMLLLVGQVGEDMLGREAFQEVDYGQMFGGIAKDVIRLDDPARTGEQMAWAFALAASGRPGPVVVVLPDDRLAIASASVARAPQPMMPPGIEPDALAAIAARLAAAERPLLIVGGPGWRAADVGNALALAERQQLPVVTGFRRKDRFDNGDPHYAGELGLGANPALVERVRSADCVIALGTRLGENVTQGYGLFDDAGAAQRLIHIHPDARALGRVWPAALAVQAGIGPALAALAGLPPATRDRSGWVEAARADQERWTMPTTVENGVNPAAIVALLGERLPGAIFTNGAGNFASWLHRFHRHRSLGTQLAPTSGAMGYGVPAAIAAAILRPGTPVVCLAGDGDFLMSGTELATVAQQGVTPLFVVLDNGQYGTIRMHQARDFPGRPSATALKNPDFAAFARSFGLHGETVDRTEDFAAALDRCVGRAALIHVRMDPREIAPGRRIAANA